jgi:tetratricopeptide (TPR) repeat protein
MKAMLTLTCLAMLLFSGAVTARTVEEFVAEAEKYQTEGDLDKAVAVLKEAAAAYPDDATVHAYLGLYRGSQAGQAYQAGNQSDAGTFLTESFELLDKAVSLDPDNPRARLYRALMGVNVPPVFGKLNAALDDLKHLVRLHEADPASVPPDMLVNAYELMGQGYSQINEYQDGIAAWEKVVELSPGTESAKAAEANIAELSAKAEAAAAEAKVDPAEVPALVARGKAHNEAGEYGQAEELLRLAVRSDPENAEAHKQLAIAIMMPLEGGETYDERIHEDTDRATNIAFSSMNHLDKAVELAPDDMEARFLNGVSAVNFPFFLGKLDQGIEYLQMVVDSDAPDETKAEAAYWLGFAYQKKGMSHWIEVVNNYPEDEAARMVLDGMRPRIMHFDPAKYPRPVIAVDFLIAFRDELAPQTAVWIETPDGEFVRTLYVSGFSGHAKEVQVVLPVWASISKFVDADAVTGASIDTGEHIYTWDLKDRSGNPVKRGKYMVKVEVHHWPSMKYQLAEGEIEIGDKETQVTVQEGDFIPFLRLHYLP